MAAASLYPLRNARWTCSASSVHVARMEHEIRWDEAEGCMQGRTVDKAQDEGLQIKAHAGNLNLDTGAFIDANWNSPS